MNRTEELETITLGPLSGRSAADWQKAPAGKWTPAQIVEHLAISLELSARGFEEARGSQRCRPKTLAERVSTWFVFRLGWIPPGIKAPRRATPAPQVEAADAERRFREGLARWTALETTLAAGPSLTVLVKHPRLGELDLGEWLRFHAWHCRHHAKQIRQRLAG